MDLKGIKLEEATKRLVHAWLLFAVLTLVFAGLFAFLLAMARTPGIQGILPGSDYFPVALVAHVDLSVVVWFLAFMGALWVITSTSFIGAQSFCPRMAWTGFWITAAGTVILTVAAIFALGTPIFSNYIPVLTHPVFYVSLVLIGLGIGLTIVETFLTLLRRGSGAIQAVTFGMAIAGAAVFIGLICFALALPRIPEWYAPGLYFERLFWGGGHILQFANTLGMVTAWILLSGLTLASFNIPERLARMGFLFYLVFMLPAPVIFFVTDISSQTYKDSFTHIMQFGMGPPTFLFGIFILKGLLNQRGINKKAGTGFSWGDPVFSSLIMSITLFIVGGSISLVISGSNVVIPAHYHGVIGAVTMAFMGLTYYIIPLLGKEIWSVKAARYQPYLYGIGQILFVLGMFWAGLHGVPRKTYGTAQNLDSMTKIISMTLMGTGGLIAIIGGASYVLNVLPSILRKNKGK